MPRKAFTPEQRLSTLKERVAIDCATGCWLWQGPKQFFGYGKTTLNGRTTTVHRAMYLLVRGAIPDGLFLDHRCRTPACCNPDHLDAVTQAENLRRSPVAPATVNAAKTHCKRGHELTPDNLRRSAKGRVCIQCERDKMREYQRKKRLAAGPKQRKPGMTAEEQKLRNREKAKAHYWRKKQGD